MILLPSRIKYNLTLGWPVHYPTYSLEADIIRKVCKEETFDLVINATSEVFGIHPITKKTMSKCLITKDLVDNYKVKKILWYNLVDPVLEDSCWYKILNYCKGKLGEKNIKTIGYIDTNKFKQDISFDFHSVFLNNCFTSYKENELIPTHLSNFFLCYNRKPHSHRKQLYESFKKNNLLDKGIFTLGNEETDLVIQSNVQEKELFENGFHGDFNIPNDILTLGPLTNWLTSFLCIVTETKHNLNTAVPFVSEKIWKPIIGMRPFVCLGDKGTISMLRESGFYTFNKFFGSNKDDLTVEDITNIVKYYKGNPIEDYKILKSKLVHNRNRFFEYVKEQKKIFNL